MDFEKAYNSVAERRGFKKNVVSMRIIENIIYEVPKSQGGVGK